MYLTLKNYVILSYKQLCEYNSNSATTFHGYLVGDLVFKLNPGLEDNNNNNICSHGTQKTPPPLRSRNSSNHRTYMYLGNCHV